MVGRDERLAAALGWAAAGVPVLPVRARAKAPLTRNGLHDATTDPGVLQGWWSRWPAANVAIATGHPGVDVLDVDVRGDESGWAALRRLRDAGLLPAGGPLVRTPSGGVHAYLLGTRQRNGSLHAEHLDFRSVGGYALVPPSTVATDTYTGSYRWERQAAPVGTLDWQAVISLLRPPPRASAPRQGRPRRRRGRDVHTLASAVGRAPVGNRNNMLFWALCEAIRSGYQDLRPIAEAAVRAGLGVREVEATWRQAVKRVTTDGRTAGPSPTGAGPCQTRHLQSSTPRGRESGR